MSEILDLMSVIIIKKGTDLKTLEIVKKKMNVAALYELLFNLKKFSWLN